MTDDYAMISGSHGDVKFCPKSGRVIGSGEYDGMNIVKVDVRLYERVFGREIKHADVLYVGFWFTCSDDPTTVLYTEPEWECIEEDARMCYFEVGGSLRPYWRNALFYLEAQTYVARSAVSMGLLRSWDPTLPFLSSSLPTEPYGRGPRMTEENTRV